MLFFKMRCERRRRGELRVILWAGETVQCFKVQPFSVQALGSQNQHNKLRVLCTPVIPVLSRGLLASSLAEET